MHIKVDTHACIGNGMCAALAPEHFEVSNDGDLTVLQDVVSEANLPSVHGAVLSCPAGAIKVVD
jgi:ferredoxin